MKHYLSFGILLFIITALFVPKIAIAEPYPYELLETIKQLEIQIKEIEAEKERIALIKAEKERLINTQIPYNTLCSCVQTAKYLGVTIPGGHNAWDLVPNSDEPKVGQLVLMAYIKTGHVAVIAEILEDGYLIIEGNYRTCQKTIRVIPKDYYAKIGFWDEDKYWLAK